MSYLDWIKRRMKVGDEIGIRIIETASPDSPTRRRKDVPRLIETSERRQHENLKKKYEEEAQ